MKAIFNYTYNGQSISKSNFESIVPSDWQDDLDEFFNYSYGYYKATLVDESIVLNPSDCVIYDYDGGYFSIEARVFNQELTILGGDSACEDHYDRGFFEDVLEKWDGKLSLCGDRYYIDVS